MTILLSYTLFVSENMTSGLQQSVFELWHSNHFRWNDLINKIMGILKEPNQIVNLNESRMIYSDRILKVPDYIN